MAGREPQQGSNNEYFERRVRVGIGLLLVLVSLFFLLATFSHDPGDPTLAAEERARNLIGPVGVVVSDVTVQFFGAVAYLLPFVVLVYGLAWIFEELQFLRKRWWALASLTLAALAFFGLHRDGFHGISARLHIGNPGGHLGFVFGWVIFGLLGKIGGTLAAAVLYGYSLVAITDFRFFAWVMDWIDRLRRGDRAGSSQALRDEARARLQRLQIAEPDEEEGGSSEEAPKPSKKSTRRRRAQPVVEVEPEVESSPDPVPDEPEPQPEPEPEPEPEPIIRGIDPEPRDEPEVIDAEENEPEDDEEIAVGGAVRGVASRDAILGSRRSEPEPEPDESEPLDEEEEDDDDDLDPDEDFLEELAGDEPAIPGGLSEDDEEDEEDEDELDDEDEDEDEEPEIEPGPAAEPAKPVSKKPIQVRRDPDAKPPHPNQVAAVPEIGDDYKLPGLTHLQYPERRSDQSETADELRQNAKTMQHTLAQFKIEVTVGEITRGPTITRYELQPAPGVKMERIANLSNNIAADLRAQRITVLAPIPGKSAVGVEVPNRVKSTVIMRDLMESEEWKNTKCKIPLVLGKDVYGKPIIADLAEMPHVLIAGATGAGKSVCINAIIASLLYRFRPDELRFVMIDPKVVELQQYNHLPHLIVPVVNDPKKVILALRWVVNEMEKRYQIFARVGVRNVASFNRRKNKKPKTNAQQELPLGGAGGEGFAVDLDAEIAAPEEDDLHIPDRLSYIVVIIDELADLMLVAPADVEMAIARITQMARAAGIHCIVATQRPSVDVITGVIKANIPSRIGFQVASKVDSRTILDSMGAEKLLGKGDMLYLPPGSGQTIRAQGVFITDDEIESVVDFIRRQSAPTYDVAIHREIERSVSDVGRGDSGGGEDDELIQKSLQILQSEGKASVSLIQRRLRIGYTRAARIMDQLEDMGIVGPKNGAEPREILVDLDDYLEG